MSADATYVLNPMLKGDQPAASNFLLAAVRRVHAAATKSKRQL